VLIDDFVDQVKFTETLNENEQASVAPSQLMYRLKLGDGDIKGTVKKELKSMRLFLFQNEASTMGSLGESIFGEPRTPRGIGR